MPHRKWVKVREDVKRAKTLLQQVYVPQNDVPTDWSELLNKLK